MAGSAKAVKTSEAATDRLAADILAGDRRALAKGITLVESTRADHREQADALLAALLPHTGKSVRLGITGVPGVGKSTFIERFGLSLIEQRPQGGGAGGRSVVEGLRRLDPGRQDADGIAVAR